MKGWGGKFERAGGEEVDNWSFMWKKNKILQRHPRTLTCDRPIG